MFVREIPTGSPNIKPFWSSNLHKLSTFWRQNIWPKHVPKFPTASPPWLAFTRTWLGFRAGSSTGRSCKTCGDAQWILGMWMAWKRWVGFNQENAGVEEYWWNINDLRTIFMEHLHGRLAGYSWNVGWYPPGFIAGKILCEWTEFFIAMLCDKLPEGSSYGFSASNFCCVLRFQTWFKAWACTWFYQPGAKIDEQCQKHVGSRFQQWTIITSILSSSFTPSSTSVVVLHPYPTSPKRCGKSIAIGDGWSNRP